MTGTKKNFKNSQKALFKGRSSSARAACREKPVRTPKKLLLPHPAPAQLHQELGSPMAQQRCGCVPEQRLTNSRHPPGTTIPSKAAHTIMKNQLKTAGGEEKVQFHSGFYFSISRHWFGLGFFFLDRYLLPVSNDKTRD